MENQAQTPQHPNGLPKALLIGVFGGLVLVAIPYFLVFLLGYAGQLDPAASRDFVPKYSVSLIIILPLLQGFLTGFFAGTTKPKSGDTLASVISILFVDFFVAAILFKEGLICLIMSAPLFAMIVWVGLFAGRPFARGSGGKILPATLIPVIMAVVAYDTHSSTPVTASAISDAVTINAPPEVVWKYIVQYPEIADVPDYWLWKLGLPAPIQSVAEGASVGAKRQCKFTGGIVFEEEITEIIPSKVLTFNITKQPDHPELIGHFSLDKGQLFLEANADGSTTVVATSWYRLYVRPSTYFDWWATDIVRNVHYRVLGQMKKLAEADQAANLVSMR